MVSALDSGSKGLGSSPGQVIALCYVLGQDTLLSQGNLTIAGGVGEGG